MIKARAHTELVDTLGRFQEDLKRDWLDKSLPEDWNALDHWQPINPHKTRVTLRLDTDMVKWFRKLGPNYGPRMNTILRVYWTALLSGQIHSHLKDDTTPQMLLETGEKLRQLRER